MVNREFLDKLIQKDEAKNWWQPELFDLHIKNELPKELEILSPPPKKEENYNCFIYTLGLQDNHEIIEDSKGFIYSNFMKKLIEEKKLEETTAPEDGDYVFYEDPENYPGLITHSGVMMGDKVVSKWAWGPLLKHDLMDMPQSYGNKTSYYKKITPNQARELYNQYKEFNVV